MKLNSIISRFIFRELIPPFVINLVFFMFVFLMREILDITNMIVNYQVSLGAFFLMIVYSMPYFLVYIIPMSVMMSILLTFLRMSSDNEIVALKAGGTSVYGLMPPVLAFAVCGFLLTAAMAAWGMPWGKTAYERLSVEVVRSNFNIGLTEGHFNDRFDGLMFYINDVDMQTRKLQDVFVVDERQGAISSTVVAPRGDLLKGSDPYTFVLRLYDGIVSQVELDRRAAHATRFETYDFRIDLKDAAADLASRRKDEKEMRLSELREHLKTAESRDKRYYSVLMEFHRKFSIPFACIALGVLAMPLGIHSVSDRKSAGLGLGLFCFLLYYLLLSAGMVLGKSGRFHPAVGLWAPNAVMGSLGIYLLVKTAKDQPVLLFSGLRSVSARIWALLQEKLRT
jgi:lipopolysaccharide export system permease protein